MKALILLSGGIDSTVALAEAVHLGREIKTLFINYGQRNHKEIPAAVRVAAFYGSVLRVITCKGILPNCPLTGVGNLPTNRNMEEISGAIGATYVPCRNAVFLSIATSWAESWGCQEVWIGFNYVDAQGRPVPDGRFEFLRALELALMLGSKCGVEGRHIELVAPLIDMNKSGIIQRGAHLGAPLHLTWSCFAETPKPCGECDACVTRKWGFKEAKIKDPASGLLIR